jgi:hypothetical protein
MSALVLEHLKHLQTGMTRVEDNLRDIKAEIVTVKDIMGSLIPSAPAGTVRSLSLSPAYD